MFKRRNDSIIESNAILKDIHGSTIFLRNIFSYFEILFLLLIRYLWILDYIFFLASLQLFPTGKQIVPISSSTYLPISFQFGIKRHPYVTNFN